MKKSCENCFYIDIPSDMEPCVRCCRNTNMLRHDFWFTVTGT